MGRFSEGKEEKKGSLSSLKDKADEKEKSDKIRRSYMLTEEQIGKLYKLKGSKYFDKTLSDIIGYLIEKESLD